MKIHNQFRFGGAAAACVVALTLPNVAQAQSAPATSEQIYAGLLSQAPNSGDAKITPLFLGPAGLLQGNPVTYTVPNPSIALNNLSPQGVTDLLGQNPSAIQGYTALTNVSGALLATTYLNLAAFGIPSRFDVTVPCRSFYSLVDVPNPNGTLTNASDVYGVRFTSNSYAANYSAYQSYLRDGAQPAGYTGSARPTSAEFRQSVYECGVPNNPDNPLVGSFDSLQSSMIDGGLNLADPDPATTPELALDTSEWGAGLRLGRVERNGRAGVQADGILNKSWRLGSGNRALVTLEVPFSYRDLAGQRQFRIHGALSVTVPLRRWWSVTPRIAYGYADATDQQMSGQMLSATLTNAFFLDHVGRGSLTLATLAGYSRAMQIDYLGLPIATRTSNYAFRNGLAYEYPLGERLFGRQTSLRASYAFTVYGGDDLYGRWMHEATVSLGVRKRGTDVRNRFETFRVGFIGRIARNANSEHLFVGVRF